MKKSIVLLLTPLMTLLLCGIAFATPRFAALIQKYEGQNVVEIVGLQDDEKNAGVKTFNEAVRSTAGKFYENFRKRGALDGEWVEITSYPIESKNYLQVVTRYVEYPSYGSDGNIMSAVYDKKKNDVVTLADVLKQYGLDDKKLTDKAAKFYENFRKRDEKITEARAAAFYIWESDDSKTSDTLIILQVTIDDPDTSEWTYFYAYSPQAEANDWAHGLFEPMRPDSLFSIYNVVKMTPPLRVNQKGF